MLVYADEYNAVKVDCSMHARVRVNLWRRVAPQQNLAWNSVCEVNPRVKVNLWLANL